MQFAYKRYHSTNMCTTMIKEKASYYNRHTYVFMCTLDAPKAFDRVHIGKLFALLHNWGLPHVANRLLLDMCTHAPTHVYHMEWGQIAVLCYRKWCKARRILSPILFCVYIDELLNRLLSLALDAIWVIYRMHVLDTLTMSIYLRHLSVLFMTWLKNCEKFAKEYHVLFNEKKVLYAYRGEWYGTV